MKKQDTFASAATAAAAVAKAAESETQVQRKTQATTQSSDRKAAKRRHTQICDATTAGTCFFCEPQRRQPPCDIVTGPLDMAPRLHRRGSRTMPANDQALWSRQRTHAP